MNQKTILIALLLVVSQLSFSQNQSFLQFSTGYTFVHFTDFATSPLKYEGLPFYLSVGHQGLNDRRSSSLNFSCAFGELSNNFNSQESSSRLQSFTLGYAETFKLGFLSTEKRNIKVGGEFNTTANYRKNPALFNSSKGVEIIGTLFGSIQARFNFLKADKPNQFLFANLDIGLINSSYRNGFAYVNQSPVLNEDQFFEDYKFLVFSGYRYRGELGYIWYLKNTNLLSLAYLWEAYSTGKENRSFQMASHILKLTFHFNLK